MMAKLDRAKLDEAADKLFRRVAEGTQSQTPLGADAMIAFGNDLIQASRTPRDARDFFASVPDETKRVIIAAAATGFLETARRMTRETSVDQKIRDALDS